MSCEYTEQLLALYVGDDLPDAERRSVEEHAAACLCCRQRIDELEESRSILRSLQQDTVAPEVLSSIQSEILRSVAGMQASVDWRMQIERAWLFSWRRRTAWVAVAIAPLVLVLAAAALSRLEWRGVPPPTAPQAPTARPGSQADDVVLQLFTDDPNVTIYWFLDRNGG